jgi:hypothetical protein
MNAPPQGGDDAYGDRPARRQKVQPLPAAQAAYAAALAASAASAGPILRCELCQVRPCLPALQDHGRRCFAAAAIFPTPHRSRGGGCAASDGSATPRQAPGLLRSGARVTQLLCGACNLAPQASFATDAQLAQHIEGPVHKKAAAKAADAAAKRQHASQYEDMAKAALQAAAWQGAAGGGSRAGGGSGGGGGPRRQAAQQQQQQQQGRGRGRWQQAQEQRPAARRAGEVYSHEQALAAARGGADELSIDGGLDGGGGRDDGDLFWADRCCWWAAGMTA